MQRDDDEDGVEEEDRSQERERHFVRACSEEPAVPKFTGKMTHIRMSPLHVISLHRSRLFKHMQVQCRRPE